MNGMTDVQVLDLFKQMCAILKDKSAIRGLTLMVWNPDGHAAVGVAWPEKELPALLSIITEFKVALEAKIGQPETTGTTEPEEGFAV